MNIKCMIIDDEPLAINIIRKYIAELSFLELISSSTNPVEGLEILQNQSIDLLFLDINMSKLSGLSLIKSLSSPPLVIFTTAYSEHAVEGFELEAVDYLLKPFSFERFLKAVNKVCKQLKINEPRQASFNQDYTNLTIKADRKLYRIRTEEILYLQAFGDYVKIITRNKKYLPKETLNNIEQRLSPQKFMRIHRSYIVALDAIQFMEGNVLHIEGNNIPIGQSYKGQLLEKLR